MKATYNGITYELETENDVKLFKHISNEKIDVDVVINTPHFKRGTYKKSMKNKVWSDNEIKLLLENKNKSAKQLAKMFGRSKDSIKSRLWILKNKNSVVTKTQNGLNDYQNKVLTYYNDGNKPSGIAKLLNVKMGKLYETLRMLKKTGLIKSGKNRLYTTTKYKKHKKPDFFNKLEQLILQGKDSKQIMDETGATRQQIWDKKWRMKRDGILKVSKNSLDTATFDYVSVNDMPAARGFIKACIQSKRKFSLRDCEIYLGLSLSEGRAFMLDVFQQQEKLGYKVKLEDNCLNFGA
jgi:transposase